MIYDIKYTKAVLKQLHKMDTYTRTMLLQWIDKNLTKCENPFLHGKELKGNLKGQWKYRVGDYHILTEIHNDELIILIINIGHRKEVYGK